MSRVGSPLMTGDSIISQDFFSCVGLSMETEKTIGKGLTLNSTKICFASYFIMFDSLNKSQSWAFFLDLCLNASNHWKPSMSRKKKSSSVGWSFILFLLWWFEANYRLWVVPTWAKWNESLSNYFNNEERKIHFSFHYLKISSIC